MAEMEEGIQDLLLNFACLFLELGVRHIPLLTPVGDFMACIGVFCLKGGFLSDDQNQSLSRGK